MVVLTYPFHPHDTTGRRPWSFFQKCREQITAIQAYILDPTKSERAGLGCPCILWEPIRETSSHTTHQGWKHLYTGISASLAPVDLKSGAGACELIFT